MNTTDTFDQEKFTVEGSEIPWLTVFSDADEALRDRRLPREGHAYFSYENYSCRNVLGIPATTCTLRGPQRNKPVLNVDYQLSPLKHGFFERAHAPYMRLLYRRFGIPDKVNRNYNPKGYSKPYLSGAVVYHAEWILGDISVGLSVYGGNRTSDQGESRACLYVRFINEIKAAAIYIERNMPEQHDIEKALANTVPEIYTLEYEQRAFSTKMYDPDEPLETQVTAEERAAQTALYKEGMLQTAPGLSESLATNQVALYAGVAAGQWVLCNKWDAVLLRVGTRPVIFEDGLPARGPGYYAMLAKSLLISDSRRSGALKGLKDKLKENGFAIDYVEGLDD